MNAPAITRYVHLVCGAEPGDAIAVSCTARLDPHHRWAGGLNDAGERARQI